ncbi:Transcriptional repressor XBP1 [Madurella mycetomatis]|uniref:Transcriptional repressor XBP1 n=1 Tax=Madurella mycetomatis TaxID=100816 RepID=A0A175VUC9_9PEZI|nr:Transcriptional repressor XBP1 [Madurella mycetomatis]
MVSVADLLNPEPPRAPLPSFRPAPTPSSRRIPPSADGTVPVTPSNGSPRMTENAKHPAKGRVKGVVNFPPFEVLEEASLAQVRRFRVDPFGSIQGTCRRIPYNSGKKDFFSKTGREVFEIFHYDFKMPGDDTPFTVMWDYNVGLVRMTSFFKCHGYSKTTPAKMLNQNPGLKDITYSITGGSIKAQGYWMPFPCARAVCATFCYKIAGALIPLFGPRFPSECVPEKAPGFGRMVIDSAIVACAKRDAAMLFRISRPSLPSPRLSHSISPPPPSYLSRRMAEPYPLEAAYGRHALQSPYGTDTDVDIQAGSEAYGSRSMYPALPPLRRPSPPGAPALIQTPSTGWAAVSRPPLHQYHYRPAPYYPDHPDREPFPAISANADTNRNANMTANPWLSAVPRSPTPPDGRPFIPNRPPRSSISTQSSGENPHSHSSSNAQPRPTPNKRAFDRVDADADEGYDAGCESRSQIQSRSKSASLVRAHDSPTPVAQMTPPAAIDKETAADGNDTSSGEDSGGGDTTNERRATEKDVALVLIHMHTYTPGIVGRKKQLQEGEGEGEGRQQREDGGGGGSGSDEDGGERMRGENDREKKSRGGSGGRPWHEYESEAAEDVDVIKCGLLAGLVVAG